MLLFWNLLYSFMWYIIYIWYNIILTSNSKFKIEKINKIKIKIRKEVKINKVYYLQLWQLKF